jgi:hypothetical protein
MAEIVNLKRAKKTKARRAADETAAVNRAHYGASRAAKKLAKLQSEKDAAALNAHKLGDER